MSSTWRSARARGACSWRAEQRRQQAGIDLTVGAAQQVFAHRARRVDGSGLEGAHQAALDQHVGRQPGHVLAGKPHRAAARARHAGNQIDGGGLAGAVRPDDAEDFPLRDVEAQLRHGLHAAEALGEAIDREQRRHNPRTASATSASLGLAPGSEPRMRRRTSIRPPGMNAMVANRMAPNRICCTFT